MYVVQLLSCVRLFATLWTAAHQASLSFTISQNLLKSMSFESVMPSNHLVLCHPLSVGTSQFGGEQRWDKKEKTFLEREVNHKLGRETQF